jgi:hypothetical protein
MQNDSSNPEKPADQGNLSWLPESLVRRCVLAAITLMLSAMVFAAYLRPNMVFDFANMIFCG